MSSQGYRRNIRLDAGLLRAARHGNLTAYAIKSGLSPSETIGRIYWLKRQAASYRKQVAARVARLDAEESKNGIR